MKTRLLSLALLLCCFSAARAATITVNSTADPAGFNPNITIAQLGATVTLRDAVDAANNTGGNNNIVFAPAIAGQTISLSQIGLSQAGDNSALNITSTITITGPTGGVTISRADGFNMRLFWVSNNGNLTVSGLTLQRGVAVTGGGIQNTGVLAVNSATITGCQAGSTRGGGIYNAATLTVSGSTFSSDNATVNGGAIYNAVGATFTVTNTSFSNNSAFASGGAIATADTGGQSAVSGCTFTSNQVTGANSGVTSDGLGGGAIENGGVLTVSTSTFDSNTSAHSYNGGAISNYGTLTLTANTLVRNVANASGTQGNGGALENQGQATATNCTFTQNNATAGTAIDSGSGTLNLNFCTIVAQQAGNAAVEVQLPSTITNSIICLNYNSASQPLNVSGDFNGNNNLIGNASPGVSALGSYGGPTQTMALLDNSPAIDAGLATGGVTTDQRGVSRPQGVRVDIGAFEYGILPASFTSGNAATFFIGTLNRFQVTASGLPAPVISATGALPAGVTISSSGLLSGNPAAGTGGSYPITLTASNSSGQVTQQFTLTVSQTNLIVTTAVDEDNGTIDPTKGTGTSLREAINAAMQMGGSQTIVFSPSLAGQTIAVTGGSNFGDGPTAFYIATSVTIQGLANDNGITLARATTGDLRGFEVAGGTLTLNDLTLANWHYAYGAAILHFNGTSIQLNRCTVRDNSGGSAIVAGGFPSATFQNCTVTNNSDDYTMRNNGGYTLINCTVTGNPGGGLYVSNNGSTLINTILAGNTAGGNQDYPNSFFVSGSSNNIVGVPANQLQLGPLANNGGPTQTMALLGGPAIFGGVAVSGITTDQRGVPRGSVPDIGAFQAGLGPVVTINPQNQAMPVGATATFNALARNMFGGTAPNTMSSNAVLLPNQYLLSPNHDYQLLYQSDGNLVLYRGDGPALWSSGTAGQTPDHVLMQSDGNLVIYGPGGAVQYATGTSGNPNAVLTLQNDGNLVIYGASGAVFATNTNSPSPTAAPTVQWQMSTDNGATFTDIPGANAVTLSFTVALANNGNQYRAVFSNASTIVQPSTPATLTVLTSLQAWRTLQGLAGDGSQDFLTPANDGVANLLKFAFNMAPNAGDLSHSNVSILTANGTAGLPLITRNSQGHLVITFVRRMASTDPGVTYTVETGAAVNNLTTLDLTGATVTPIDSTWERVTVTDPATTPTRFGRVRVTVTP